MSSWANYFNSKNFFYQLLLVGVTILLVYIATQLVEVTILMVIPTNNSF